MFRDETTRARRAEEAEYHIIIALHKDRSSPMALEVPSEKKPGMSSWVKDNMGSVSKGNLEDL